MNQFYSRYYIYIRPVIKNAYVRTYSSIIFSLIAVVFFSFFAIRPTFKTVITLRKDIVSQQQTLEQLSQKSQNLEAGIKNYNSLDKATLKKLDNLVPSKLALASFMNELSDIASRHQATISALQLQPFEIDAQAKTPVSESDLKEITFAFNLQGSYASLVNVLNSLSLTNHLIIVDTVNFNKNDAGLIMTISARTIY